MKQFGLFLVGMVVPFLQVGWGGALNGHAPYCHYTINISGSSTIYDDWMSFNGCSATVGGFVFTPPFNAEYGRPRGSDGGTFDATFVADAGYVFLGNAGIGIADFTWYNGGYQLWDILWHVSDANYAGPPRVDLGPGRWRLITPDSLGVGGEAYYWNPWAGSGGTATGLNEPFLGAPLTFQGVSSFTVHLSESAWGHDWQTHASTQMGFYAETATAPPAPEPGSVILLLFGLAGAAGTRRRFR